MRVYHGTAVVLASSILERGLRPDPNGFVYVTPHRAIAEQFAYLHTDHFIECHDGLPDGAIATADVARSSLTPDGEDRTTGHAWRLPGPAH